mgnify:CR=1 FL=1
MLRTHGNWLLAAALLALFLTTAGCAPGDQDAQPAAKPLPGTVAELADALCEAGIGHAQRAPADLPKMQRARIDASTALVNDGLRVEIVKITDERTWKAFLGASMLMAGSGEGLFDVMKGRTPEEAPASQSPAADQMPKVYPAPPFAVLVRDEPEDGLVKRAFEAVYHINE